MITAKAPPNPAQERKKLIEHMLSAVESEFADRCRTSVGALRFIESLREQFDNQGWLSENQLEALRKFYANAS